MKRDNKYLKNNQFAKGNSPNKTSFKKGCTPWNQGQKGDHISIKTEFKKGCVGIRSLPIGTITKRKDKGGKIRQWIKIENPKTWIEYARYVWIKYNGNISKGYIIHHIDRNTLNDSIGNLIVLTRGEHLKEHRNIRKIL